MKYPTRHSTLKRMKLISLGILEKFLDKLTLKQLRVVNLTSPFLWFLEICIVKREGETFNSIIIHTIPGNFI